MRPKPRPTAPGGRQSAAYFWNSRHIGKRHVRERAELRQRAEREGHFFQARLGDQVAIELLPV